MTPADLHAAVVAAVMVRLELAKEATPGPWLADPTGTVCAEADLVDDMLPEGGPMEVAECYRSQRPHDSERAANAAHIAANDPAATIRHCEVDLATLEEHRPRWDDEYASWFCDCGDDGGAPCGELTRRANAYAVVEPLPPPA